MALCRGRDRDRISVKDTDQSETMIPVMNLTDESHTLYRGTRIMEAHVITKCDNVVGINAADDYL